MYQPLPTDKPVLLFDGVCNLCNGIIRFLIRHDPEERLRFASLQSEAGQQLLALCDARTDHPLPNTVVLVQEGKCYTKSEAALRTLQVLGRGYSWLSRSLSWFPRPLRDAVYDWVSRNRYRWFGKRDACLLPTPDLNRRFLPGG